MKIYKLFDIDFIKKELLSFVGAGGKTTAIFKLAEEIRAMDKKVLIATSTAMYCPEKRDYDKLIINNSRDIMQSLDKLDRGTITVIARGVSKEDKLLGLNKEIIEEIHSNKLFDCILVEADGAKRRPIKAPADYEPVIPSNTDKTIGVIGMDSLGKIITEENVHRLKLFCSITDSKREDLIDEEIILKLIQNSNGLFKDVPVKSKKYILLNKIDNKKEERKALKIIDLTIKSGFCPDGIIAANIAQGKINYKWSDLN